jgi:hypothetical protein
VQRDSANTATNFIQATNMFETINTIPFVGKAIVYSFYARAGANFSSASSALGVQLVTGTGTDQNSTSGFTGVATPINSTATLTTTWQRFSFTTTIATSVTQIALATYYTPVGTAGANDYYEITGVQLEVGSVATPFKTYAATLQGELSACQRYYYRINNNPSGYGIYGTGFGSSTTNANVYVFYPVTMRQIATAIDYSTASTTLEVFDGTTQFNASAISYNSNESWNNGATLNVTVSGMTNYRPVKGMFQGGTSGYIGFSAEL